MGCLGVSPSPPGDGSGENFFDFGAQKGEFWCILSATFAVDYDYQKTTTAKHL